MREREEMYETCDSVEQTQQCARHFLQMLPPSLPFDWHVRTLIIFPTPIGFPHNKRIKR